MDLKFYLCCSWLIFLQFISIANTWHALKDAEIPNFGSIPTKDIPETPFVILRIMISWEEAKRICAVMYYRLAVLPKIEDAKKIAQKIAISSQKFTTEYWTAKAKYEYGMDRRYWIGLSDLEEEGTWAWDKDNETLSYEDFWYPGQPDHDNGRPEHCVTLWNPGFYHGDQHKFNDEECKNRHYAICEKAPLIKTAPKRKGSRYGLAAHVGGG